MADEILKIRGRLGEAEKQKVILEAAIDVDMVGVRDVLDVFADDLSAIKIEDATVSFDRLKTEIPKLRNVNNKIKEYKAALGEE